MLGRRAMPIHSGTIPADNLEQVLLYPVGPVYLPKETTVGTLFSTFSIARSGLQVAQVQLDVSGHNIANVNKPGFSRQRVELITNSPTSLAFGQLGRGVRVGRITRLRDTFLDDLFRRQVPGLNEAQVRAEFFNQVEDVFLEPGPNGLGGRLNRFFDSLNEFANNVEEIPVRQSVLNEADALVALFRETAERLDVLRTNANEEAKSLVPQINTLSAQVADLNIQIRQGELGGNTSSDLRDDRDLILDQLAGLVNIFTRERADGQVDVLVGGAQLVNGNAFREVETFPDTTVDPERPDLVRVRFADDQSDFAVTGGELFGALQVRDQDIASVNDRIDTIATTIIEQINRIHTRANGLRNFGGTATGSNGVSGAATALNSAGLPFGVTTGTFDVQVYDAAGVLISNSTIALDPTVDSLSSLVTALNGINPNVTASATADNRLSVTATGGFTYTVLNDSTGIFTALGFNGLFTGTNARTIGVNQDIVNDPGLLASGYSLDPLSTGNNDAALEMADVRNLRVLEAGTSTINDFYESTVVKIGISARANRDNLDVEQSFVDSFERRRQEVSGVSLDEEATYLLQFQRAFEASARVVTTTDRMLDALLAMVQ